MINKENIDARLYRNHSLRSEYPLGEGETNSVKADRQPQTTGKSRALGKFFSPILREFFISFITRSSFSRVTINGEPTTRYTYNCAGQYPSGLPGNRQVLIAEEEGNDEAVQN